MTSARKISANRRNASKSTGPRTPTGKAVSARNALRHGILSSELLLPSEDSAILVKLEEKLQIEFRPVGELETLLVNRIVAAVWRLQRLGRVESEMFAAEAHRREAEEARSEAARYTRHEPSEFDKLMHFPDTQGRTVVVDQERHDAAQRKAASAERKRAGSGLGTAFVNTSAASDAFSKLSRYETTIERSLFRNLHELQRLQAARTGERVPLPVALDVEVSQAPGSL